MANTLCDRTIRVSIASVPTELVTVWSQVFVCVCVCVCVWAPGLPGADVFSILSST